MGHVQYQTLVSIQLFPRSSGGGVLSKAVHMDCSTVLSFPRSYTTHGQHSATHGEMIGVIVPGDHRAGGIILALLLSMWLTGWHAGS